jgi:uncharacterized protein (DUF1810 family)
LYNHQEDDDLREDKMSLDRFIEAQKYDYARALREIKNGKKTSHWMWYIFPQIEGLGRSLTARKYAIRSAEEAEEYLRHPLLGNRLREISEELLKLPGNDPVKVFGFTDALKLKSCMTLFSMTADDPSVFLQVLRKYYGGEKCIRTAEFLSGLPEIGG